MPCSVNIGRVERRRRSASSARRVSTGAAARCREVKCRNAGAIMKMLAPAYARKMPPHDEMTLVYDYQMAMSFGDCKFSFHDSYHTGACWRFLSYFFH